MAHITQCMQIPTKEAYDVIVCGGGVAGVAASLAVARAGKHVLLLEKSVMLGGLATLGLISWYEPLCDGHGRQLMHGMAEELLRLSIRYGPDSLAEQWRKDETPPPHPHAPTEQRRLATHFSPNYFVMALDELLLAAGVEIRFDILAAAPHMENGQVQGVITESKSGREYFPAKVVIDTTGDADLLWRAGVPCVEGQNFLSYVCHFADLDDAKKAAETKNVLELRKWVNPASDLFGHGHPDGYPRYAGVRNEEVTDFVLEGRRRLFDRLRQGERFSRDVMALPGMAQFRTTRRIEGAYCLTEHDNQLHHANSIGLAADFIHRGRWYEIPWGCLYNPGFGNLLTAGRSVSASGHGWEVSRVIPVAVLTGQAAGTAAALMLEHGTDANRLPVASLQQALRKQGVRISHDEI